MGFAPELQTIDNCNNCKPCTESNNIKALIFRQYARTESEILIITSKCQNDWVGINSKCNNKAVNTKEIYDRLAGTEMPNPRLRNISCCVKTAYREICCDCGCDYIILP